MIWKVGKEYKLRSGDIARVLATDSKAFELPLVVMRLFDGCILYLREDGRVRQKNHPDTLQDLMPPVTKISGWMGIYKWTHNNNRSTTHIYSTRADVESLIDSTAWHIVPVSFEIPEED